MYAQFRTQYPTAGLTAELIQSQDSQFIVRAIVSVGETILATGFSAAPSIEQAEDQARARALLVLGIGLPAYNSSMHVVDSPSQELPPSPQAQLNPARQPALDQSDSRWDGALNWDGTPDEDYDFLPPDNPHLEEESLSPPKANGAGRAPVRAKVAAPRSARAGATQKSPLPEQSPIDLSDIIAQTDIELKRLGWTHVQGRQFLETTYCKRSRQQLTDDELIAFLHYLKSQSGEQDPPF
jgi:hypothetical protein